MFDCRFRSQSGLIAPSGTQSHWVRLGIAWELRHSRFCTTKCNSTNHHVVQRGQDFTIVATYWSRGTLPLRFQLHSDDC